MGGIVESLAEGRGDGLARDGKKAVTVGKEAMDVDQHTLEHGALVQIPQFVGPGDIVMIPRLRGLSPYSSLPLVNTAIAIAAIMTTPDPI